MHSSLQCRDGISSVTGQHCSLLGVRFCQKLAESNFYGGQLNKDEKQAAASVLLTVAAVGLLRKWTKLYWRGVVAAGLLGRSMESMRVVGASNGKLMLYEYSVVVVVEAVVAVVEAEVVMTGGGGRKRAVISSLNSLSPHGSARVSRSSSESRARCTALGTTSRQQNTSNLASPLSSQRNYCPRGSDGLYCFRRSFFSLSTR